ncbi:MFS transporter [Filobacillus milosensis]|uniref:MFS transporter n=1 Tax=Filobacillus milosensis TaxID=94137 RepID=A0A4Y8IDU0_9BACI|nr:MFS transporter [Filobacillus milosensis]TFB13226.1 MFS transporter [Filobacillus milosensis]
MFNNKISNTSFYYGWVVVLISGLGVFFSGPGQTFAISIFIDYYIEDFEYSRAFVSSLYSIATLMAGFLLFTVGKLADIYGQRVMMVAIGSALAFAAFWNSLISGPIMMFLGFFMLRLFGQGSMTLLPNTLVPQWFLKIRGRALSVMAIGGFASAALFPPMNAFFIQEFGWRTTWMIWGIALLIIFVPLVAIFVRNKPEDIGEVIDGKNASMKIKVKNASRLQLFLTVSINVLILLTLIPVINEYLMDQFEWFPAIYIRILLLAVSIIAFMIVLRKRHLTKMNYQADSGEKPDKEDITEDNEISWTLKEARKTKVFWAILICVSVPAMTNTGITFHLVSIIENKGLDQDTAAIIASIILSLMAIIGFPVTFVSGYLVDKFKVNYVLAATFFIHVVAIIWLFFVSTATGAIVYGVIWGIAHGFERIALNIVWPNYFGRTHLGSIKSIAQSTMVVGSALGPLPFGYFYEWFNGYGEILLVMVCFPLIAMLIAVFSPAPEYEKYQSE